MQMQKRWTTDWLFNAFCFVIDLKKGIDQRTFFSIAFIRNKIVRKAGYRSTGNPKPNKV